MIDTAQITLAAIVRVLINEDFRWIAASLILALPAIHVCFGSKAAFLFIENDIRSCLVSGRALRGDWIQERADVQRAGAAQNEGSAAIKSVSQTRALAAPSHASHYRS